MPVRLVCPSCSATLSVKDEYAGRAIKCPKCQGVIPAAQAPQAPAPAPTPEPEPPAAPVDAPAVPKPKVTARPVKTPVAKVASGDRSDEDEKPARRNDRDDRPRRNRRSRNDEYADDPPRAEKGGSSAALILGILGFFLLTCIGSVGYGVYWFTNRVTEGVQQARENFHEAKERLEKWNPAVTLWNYEQLLVGAATRGELEKTLGAGQRATFEDLNAVFRDDHNKITMWAVQVGQGRAVVWRNGDDYLIAAFHPNADASGRLQMKEWRPKNGANAAQGELDDEKFLAKYPPGFGVSVPAEVLARAYKDNTFNADRLYRSKPVVVEGKVSDITFGFGGEVQVILEGVPALPGLTGMQVRGAVAPADVDKVLTVSRGQTVKLKGTCVGYSNERYVDVQNVTFESARPDPGSVLTAVELLDEHADNGATTDAKYTGKPITITEGVVLSKVGDTSLFVGPAKKGATRILVTLPPGARAQGARAKPGDRITVKGEYTSSGDGVISITRAWIVP